MAARVSVSGRVGPPNRGRSPRGRPPQRRDGFPLGTIRRWGRLDGSRKLALPAALGIAAAAVSDLTRFGWIDAALILVALSVVRLIARAHEPTPHNLPFHDGTLMIVDGCWSTLLALVNVLDDANGFAQLGVALCSIVLVMTGLRLRAVEDMYWYE